MGELIDKLTGFIGQFGIFSGFLLVFLESMIPILPLSVFVAINIFTYGNVIGFIVSYLGTVTGSICAYYLCIPLWRHQRRGICHTLFWLGCLPSSLHRHKNPRRHDL